MSEKDASLMSKGLKSSRWKLSCDSLVWPLTSSERVETQEIVVERKEGEGPWWVVDAPWWLDCIKVGDRVRVTPTQCGFYGGYIELGDNETSTGIRVKSSVLPDLRRAISGLMRGLTTISGVMLVALAPLMLSGAFGFVSFLGGAYSLILFPLFVLALLIVGPVALAMAAGWGVLMGNSILFLRTLVAIGFAGAITFPAIMFAQQVIGWETAERLLAVLTLGAITGIGIFILQSAGPRVALVALPLIAGISAVVFYGLESIWLEWFAPPEELGQIQKNYGNGGQAEQTIAAFLSIPFSLYYLAKLFFSELIYVQLVFTLTLPFISVLLAPIKRNLKQPSTTPIGWLAFGVPLLVNGLMFGCLVYLSSAVRGALSPAHAEAARYEELHASLVPVPQTKIAHVDLRDKRKSLQQRAHPMVLEGYLPTTPEEARAARNATPPTPVRIARTNDTRWVALDGSYPLVEVWSKPIAYPSHMLLGENGLIHIGSENRLLTYREDGEIHWSFEVDAPVDSLGRINGENSIFVHSKSNRFTALSGEGMEKWNMVIPLPVSRALSASAECVYVTRDDAAELNGSRRVNRFHLTALRKDNSTNWTRQFSGNLVGPELSADCETVYLGEREEFVALTKNGTEKWRLNLKGAAKKMYVQGQELLLVAAGPRLVAITKDGVKKWDYQPANGLVDAVDVHSSNRVLCRAENYLHVLDWNGELLFKTYFEAAIVPSDDCDFIFGIGVFGLPHLRMLSPDGVTNLRLTVKQDRLGLNAIAASNQIYVSSNSQLIALRPRGWVPGRDQALLRE